EVALAHQALDRWLADLQTAARGLSAPRVMAFLLNPKVARATKRKALEDALSGRIDRLVLNLLLLLVEKDRIAALPLIAEQFEQLVLQHRGIARARVTTAVPLDASDRQRVAARLEELTGRRVELETAVDPAIMGGLVA